MKKYKWSEVENFLNENLDSKFNYTRARVDFTKPHCLMCSFFEFKNLKDFFKVNLEGDKAFNESGEIIGKIEEFPFKRIRDIHIGCEESGQMIKTKLDEFKKTDAYEKKN